MEKIIGGSLLFITNQQTSLVFYNVIDEEYRNTQLAVYQLYICMQLSINKDMSYIDFGVSHLPKAKNPFEPKKSLIEFKEHFGSIGIIRNVYEKNIT